MELPVLLNYILGGTSIVTIVLFVMFFEQNRKLKNNAVTQSDTKTQSEQINLGMQFIENSTKAVELIQQATQNTDVKIDELVKTVNTKLSVMTRNQTSMNKQLASSNRELELIKKYLNGNYKDFLAKEAEKKAKK